MTTIEVEGKEKADLGTRRSLWVENLKMMVEKEISSKGHEFDGQKWVAHSQEWWCDRLKVSPATLRRAISKPPFVRTGALVDGQRMTLLRLGEKGPLSVREIALVMRSVWVKTIGKEVAPDVLPVSKREYGCLNGLAERWGLDGPYILITVVKNWPLFMVGAKQQEDWTVERYYEYPCLSLIRRFPEVAEEVALIIYQETKGK